MRSWKGLLVFLVLVALAASMGLWASPDGWYASLRKPSFNPPDAVFGPVWTLLYLMIAVAAWRVVRRGPPQYVIALWCLQLALNAAWSPIFFGAHETGWALADILALWVLVGSTTWVFWRADRIAGLLMIPYWAWITFATALNASIWQLNAAAPP